MYDLIDQRSQKLVYPIARNVDAAVHCSWNNRENGRSEVNLFRVINKKNRQLEKNLKVIGRRVLFTHAM